MTHLGKCCIDGIVLCTPVYKSHLVESNVGYELMRIINSKLGLLSKVYFLL